MIKRKGFFPGYLLLVGAGLMSAWGAGSMTYALGMYMKPLIKEFGWTRAQVSLGASFARLEGGLEGPIDGIAIDKWGPQIVNLVAVIIFGIGLASMYFVNSLWQFYLIWLLVATGHNTGFMKTTDAAMANWFVKRRGLMIAIMRGVSGAAVPLLLPMVSWLLIAFGWRLAFPILGAASLVILIPLTLFTLKPKRPEYYGWLPDGKKMDEQVTDTEARLKVGAEYAKKATGEVEFTLRQAMRDRIFWFFVVGLSLCTVASPVLNLHLIPLLTDRGVDPVFAAGIMGIMVFLEIPSRITFGWWADRIHITRLKYLRMLSVTAQAAAIFILIQAESMVGVWAFVVSWGLATGFMTAILAPMRGRFWGRKAYASIQGVVGPFTMFTGIIAPIYAGWVYDTTGRYTTALYALIGVLLLAGVTSFLLNPPKPPAQITDVSKII